MLPKLAKTKVFSFSVKAAFCVHGAETNASGDPEPMTIRDSAFPRDVSDSVIYVSMVCSVLLKYMNFAISWEIESIASGAKRSLEISEIRAAPSKLSMTTRPTDKRAFLATSDICKSKCAALFSGPIVETRFHRMSVSS